MPAEPMSAGCHSSASPQSVRSGSPSGRLRRDQRKWISYDETDPETQYGFQRKKRFGVKNGSDAVKQCIEWVPPKGRRGVADGSDSEEEGFQRTRLRPHQELTPKVGADTDSNEIHQLKKVLAMQHEAIRINEELVRKIQSKEHQQHQPHQPQPAWQQMPLAQMLDGETGALRQPPSTHAMQRYPSPQAGAGRQNESVQVNSLVTQVTVGTGMPPPQNSARFHPDTAEPSTRKPTGFALPLAGLAAMNREERVLSARLSARKEARKERASQDFHDPARKSYSSQNATAVTGAKVASADGGEGATHPPVNKQGLGNTMLGSPFDPRELHDPSSIDPVWRKREEARERARRLNALLGTSAADKPIIDEKQYAASIMKQHARRLKIKSFERRFQEQRLAHPQPGTTTRDYSETWMSVVSGKPPFAAFGNGNTAPTTGGLVYGDYLLSHNVSPERKPNRPGQKQTMDEARLVWGMKRREDAKTLHRLIEAGDVPPQTNSGRPSTAQQQYTANGRRIVRDVSSRGERASSLPRSSSSAPPTRIVQSSSTNGIPSVPASTPSAVGAGVSPPPVDSTSLGHAHGPPVGRLPLERAMAWELGNQANGDQAQRRSGRRQGFDQEVIGAGKNSLRETAARTMSVPPTTETTYQ